MTGYAAVWPVAVALVSVLGAVILDVARRAAKSGSANFTESQVPGWWVLPTSLLLLLLLTAIHEVAHAIAGHLVNKRLMWFTLAAFPSAELGPATRDWQQMFVSAAGPAAQALASLVLAAAGPLSLNPLRWPRLVTTLAHGLEVAQSVLAVGAVLGLGHVVLAAFLPYSRNSDCWKFWASGFAVLRRTITRRTT